mmetsp:Transcript_120110/g.285361  ORF Transcript_120110/g.285361 Transcript_120110/m.285361 type:complete len:207 (+) Transcript_120110:584-1204(+)
MQTRLGCCSRHLLPQPWLQSAQRPRTQLRHAAFTSCFLRRQDLSPAELYRALVDSPYVRLGDFALHQKCMTSRELGMLEHVGRVKLSPRLRHRHLLHSGQMLHEKPELLISFFDHLLFEDIVKIVPANHKEFRVLDALSRSQSRLIVDESELTQDTAGPQLGEPVAKVGVLVVTTEPVNCPLARQEVLQESRLFHRGEAVLFLRLI